MWWWLLLLAAAAGPCQACPAHCECSVGEDWEYLCEGANNTQFLMKATLNYEVSVECMEGDSAPCALLPAVDAAQGGNLSKVTTSRCSPAILPCLLAAGHATSVSTLMLNNPTEELAPEHLAGITLKTLLIFDAHAVNRIPSAALGAVPTLRELRIMDARGLRLSADAFAASADLRYLELSADGVRDLPAGTFRGLAELKYLLLWANEIESISNATFEGLDSLEELDLNGNSLQALQPGVFSAVPKLRFINLKQNIFQKLGPGVFSGTRLENITIQDNKANLTLDNLTFANISSLQRLVLQYNRISAVPADLFRGSDSLSTLDLSYNSLQQLPETLFQGLAVLKQLDLSYNRISELPRRVFLPLKGLVELNLNRNHIQVLPDQIFSGLRSFTTFTMDQNQLHTISKQAFLGAETLHTVSMAENRLSLQQEGYQSFSPYSPFQYLRNLRTLVLRGNLISELFGDWTNVLLQLTTLDLTFNNFTELVSDHLQFLSDAVTVDLRDNRIAAVWFSSRPLRARTPPPARRSALLLDRNPFRCDCAAFPLALLLRGAALDYAAPAFRVGGAACAGPPRLAGRALATVRPAELTCELAPPACPAACRSCAVRPAAGALELSCDVLPTNLPNPPDFGANHIKLKLNDITQLGELPETVLSLNLSGTGLRELTLRDQPHLQELDLRNNMLNIIPEAILNSNVTLYVSNNSLRCDCEHRSYVEDLLSRANVNDSAEISCSDGRRAADIDASGLCAVRDASLTAGLIFLVLAVLAIALSILVYSYYHEILVYLTHRGYLKWLLTEEVLDSDKEFDVFVSYSHLDVAFIREQLLAKLEEEFKLRVCIHDRDWVVGDMIPTQIVRSVQQSRRTLIVLSPHFLASPWAAAEFRAAHAQALRERRARVVLLVLDDAALADSRLDDDLRAYVATNTYLKRSDDKFWERLRRALPPRESSFTWLARLRRSAGAAGAAGAAGGEKAAGGGLDVHLNSRGQLVNAALSKDAV